MSNLYRTKNELPERARVETVALLNQRLADAIDDGRGALGELALRHL